MGRLARRLPRARELSQSSLPPNGDGRRTLEKLTYAYLGDWIDRQRADLKNGVEGADARVAAAVHLQSELKKILAGDPP